MGVTFNPLKSKLMMKKEELNRTEVETVETYGSTSLNKFVTLPDNITKKIAK